MSNAKKIVDLLKTSSVDKNYKRYGSYRDGGYVLIDDISENDFLISCGIDSNIDFELDLCNIVSGINAYDNSIDYLPRNIKNTSFYKKTVGSEISLQEMIDSVPENYDIILKMDIEGGEWNCFDNDIDLSRIRQMVIEFHWIVDKVKNDLEFKKVFSLFKKIKKTHFPILILPNNNEVAEIIENISIPEVIEVVFLRKSSYKEIDANIDLSNIIRKNNIVKDEIFWGYV